jgi:hypothetical protein
MKLYIMCFALALLFMGLFGLSWAGKKERWDIACWSLGLLALAFIGLDYVARWKYVQTLITWFSDPSWLIPLAIFGALIAIFAVYRLALALVYAVSRAWHQGARDARGQQDQTVSRP